MTADNELEKLQADLNSHAPYLVPVIFDKLAPDLMREGATHGDTDKIVNDPIWKIYPLNDPILSLVNLPVVQRLRRIRQLGLVHLVYPGANHTRFEHALGSMCAASRMFDTMAATARIPDRISTKYRKILLAAAVLHDIGHTVFSHVGERVLRAAFPDGFSAIQHILQTAFPEQLEYEHSEPAIPSAPEMKIKLPPAAELMSVLFVLSPAMSTVVRRLDLGYEPSESQLMIAALILGKPRNLIHENEYYYFLRNLVSGDLDCDKIDYVARDAYYAGIPTATDIDRILSQITTVEIRNETEAPEVKYKFGDGNPEVLHLYGIKAASASALEMFVMTRAYLFERLYAHPKVRAAERALERLLIQRIQFGQKRQGWTADHTLSFLYAPGGDDYLLGELGSARFDGIGDYFAQKARRILIRHLPVRALAISRQTMSFGAPAGSSIESADFVPWQLAEDEVSADPLDLEQEICQLAEIPASSTVFVDWFLPNPIREDPDIWVKDPADSRRVRRVSAYFNVEQLANAYRSTKQVAWIFADADQRYIVAASAATCLQLRYDLPPNPEAYTRAKISFRALEPHFLKFRTESRLASAVLNVQAKASDRKVRPVAAHFIQHLTALRSEDRQIAGARLAQQTGAIDLPRAYYEHLEVAKLVLEILLRHASAYWCASIFQEQLKNGNEKRFQRHLKEYCDGDALCIKIFHVVEGSEVGGGETDLVFQSKKGDIYPGVVVELKSKREDFNKIYSDHAGQPFQYSERGNLGRVSILYAQFYRREAISLGDTLLVRENGQPGSERAVICIAQKAFCDPPSQLGKTSKEITV
jgi:HD superfamily phosphohydrolase